MAIPTIFQNLMGIKYSKIYDNFSRVFSLGCVMGVVLIRLLTREKGSLFSAALVGGLFGLTVRVLIKSKPK